MSRQSTLPRACLCILFGAIVSAGCKPSLPPMAPVKGKVTLDGQPVTSGQVTFVPTDNKTDAGLLSAGTIGSDGTYEIHTEGQSGAPLGKYNVRVTPSTMAPLGATGVSVPLDTKFGEHSFEVVAAPEPGRYDLKLTK
jgi:hypothetical protein